MKKGIAIQTILLLVVGIVVAGILIFLVYRSAGGGNLDCEQCRAEFISWCTTCSLAAIAKGCSDWNVDCGLDNLGYFMSKNLVECTDKCGLHSKSDTGGFDISGAIKCINAGMWPTCIYCGESHIQDECKRVGVG